MDVKSKVVGFIKNKVTRRVAIGCDVAGLAGVTLVLAVFRGMFHKELPPGKDGKYHRVIHAKSTVERSDEGGKGTWTACVRHADGSVTYVDSGTVTQAPRKLPTIVKPERIIELPQGDR